MQLVHTGWPLLVRLVILTRLQRPQHLDHLATTSLTHYNLTVKPDRCPFKHALPLRIPGEESPNSSLKPHCQKPPIWRLLLLCFLGFLHNARVLFGSRVVIFNYIFSYQIVKMTVKYYKSAMEKSWSCSVCTPAVSHEYCNACTMGLHRRIGPTKRKSDARLLPVLSRHTSVTRRAKRCCSPSRHLIGRSQKYQREDPHCKTNHYIPQSCLEACWLSSVQPTWKSFSQTSPACSGE